MQSAAFGVNRLKA